MYSEIEICRDIVRDLRNVLLGPSEGEFRWTRGP
jgi:hypothetical protein